MASCAWHGARTEVMQGLNVALGDGRGSWGRCLCCLLIGAGGDDVAHGECLVVETVMGRLIVPVLLPACPVLG